MADTNGKISMPTWLWTGFVLVGFVALLAATLGWLVNNVSSNRDKNGVQDVRIATIEANYSNLVQQLTRMETKIDRMEAKLEKMP